jgi:predicted exporter
MIRNRVAVALWLAVLALAAAVIAQARFSTDLSAFLPQRPTAAQQLLVDELRDGVVSKLILASVSGAPPDALAAASRSLAERLRVDRRFVSVDNGDAAQFERDRAFVFEHRYLLSPAVDANHFTVQSLRTALEASLELLGSPAGMMAKPLIPADPTGEVLRLIDGMTGAARPATHEGIWVGADAQEALLVLQTRAPGYDIDAQEEALASIRNAFAEVQRSAGATALRLALTGPAVFAVETRAAIKRDAMRFSTLATILIASLLLATFRSPRVLILGLLPVASGAAVGVAAVALYFGEVHGITLGFGATLIGESVDYAIYLFMQTDPRRGAAGTLARIWPTLRLGVVTSVCGFSAMLLSGFPGLAQLGLFSIAGIATAALVTRFVLPVLLPPDFAVTGVEPLAARVRAAFGRARVLLPVVGLAVVGAVIVWIARDQRWSDELASLSPVSAAQQDLDQRLRDALGAADVRHIVVARSTSADQALALAERVGKALDHAAIGGYESPAHILPSGATQMRRRDSLPEARVLRARMAEAARGTPFRAGTFEPFITAVQQARSAPLLGRESLGGTKLGIRLDALLIQRDHAWYAMLPLSGVKDVADLRRALAPLYDAQVVLLDTKTETDAIYATYRREAVSLSLLGAIAIVVLLAAAMRSPKRALKVCIPLAAAVLVTTGALLALGQTLTMFHLVGMLLVVAVGSNYSLFFDGSSGAPNDRTSLSLALANITTVTGFGMLGFSSVPVLAAIGTTVGLGAALSLIFAAALAPRARAS